MKLLAAACIMFALAMPMTNAVGQVTTSQFDNMRTGCPRFAPLFPDQSRFTIAGFGALTWENN
jgi:hypothetical protein